MEHTVRQFQRGQGLVEYALLLVLVAFVAVLALSAAGVSIKDVYNQVVAALRGENAACYPYARSGREWDNFQGKYSKGGVAQDETGYIVCPQCGGILPGYSGSDYAVNLSGVEVKKTNPTWNGYGVAFRTENGPNGLNGYMFEIEKVNKNNPMRLYFTKLVNGVQIRPFIKMVSLPVDIDLNNPPDISVKVSGNTFTAYLDGKEVLQGSDNTYTEGNAGVISYAGMELRFSDFTVDPLDCEEVK